MSIDLVWIHELESHNKIKSSILNCIDEYDQINECPDPVTKTDFYDNRPNQHSNYFSILEQNAEPLWKEICNKYWVKEFSIGGCWFQQYNTNSWHGWHLHGNASISLSYLLELPERKFSTEFIDIERKTTFQVDVEEGDVIIFPSYVIHRSPVITDSNVRKTTIAINLNLGDVNTTMINPFDPIFDNE
tara:strand:- start:61 stop:624 length:564 start_codon:yes stop_codon:yes gene_type:complete